MNLLQMTISGGVLVLAVALVRTLTLRVLPKRTFLILWAIVLIRLLIPFAPLFRLSISVPAFPTRQENHVNAVSPSVRDTNPAPPTPVRTDGNAAGNPRPAHRPPIQAQTQTTVDWPRIVWMAVAFTVGICFLVLYLTGYRKFRQAFPVEHDAAREWRKTHPLRRKFAVKSLGGLDSPMTYGVLRPVILAPGAPSWWNSPEAKFALEHEYVHMRRGDTAFKFALALALTVHWFNPVIWAFYMLANRDIELSCDEEALDRLGGMERAAYARTLLAEVERRQKPPAPFAGFGADAAKERIVEIMNYRKKSPFCIAAAGLLALALAACSAAGPTNGTSDTAETKGVSSAVNGGMRLSVPPEYDDLLVIETPQNDAEGVLFSVSEKASIEAAKALGEEYDGAGWLFSIGTVSEDELHEMLCYDMSGAETFAKDENGQYYMYYHPTDVRLVRENDDNMEEDFRQWGILNEWAATVPESFIAENPGLAAEKYGNTELDMYLARIAYMDGVKYTISATESGPMEPLDVDPMPYLNRLMNGVTLEYDGGETPDGEYIVLNFPDDDMRFDFFRMEGKENYIRMVWAGGNEMLYKASYADGTTKAGVVMNEWYNALAAANAGEPLETSGFTGEKFVGEWQDSVSQRAVLNITDAIEMNEMDVNEPGVYYSVAVHWGGSYNSAVQWRMKATVGAQDEILSYENGVKVEITFPEDENAPAEETVIWDNGTGYFMFRDGYLTWYDEQETQAADCRFVKVE